MVRAMTKLWSLVLTLVLTASFALAATGCGSNDEANSYVDQVNAIQTKLQTDATAAIAGGAPTSGAEAAQFAKKLQGLFAQAADDLEAVTPPDDVADLHAQLVAKVREIGDQIGKAADAFASGNPQQIQQAATELQTAIGSAQGELSSLIDQINSTLQG
jgi:Family of unknown function (DUF6376)